MSLELRIEKINSEFYNSNKHILSEKELKELLDSRESKIRAISYLYESLEFEKEFSKICNDFNLFVFFMLPPSSNRPPNIRSESHELSQLHKELKQIKPDRLLTSGILKNKDVNPELNMKFRQMERENEMFKNPTPPNRYTQQTRIETKAAKSPNKSSFFESVLKFIFLILLIVAGVGSVVLFLLRLGLSSGW